MAIVVVALGVAAMVALDVFLQRMHAGQVARNAARA